MKTLLLLFLLMFGFGCATTPRPPALTQADIISMVKAGMADEDIMRRIEASRTVFRLNADDIVLLRNQGVSDRLVTYMMDTFTRAALAEQERRYDYRWGFSYGHYWGHPHWWW